MLNVDDADFGILAKLRQEFIDVARNQLDGIDKKLDQLDSAQPGADEVLHSIQRDIHNIMGQGATFGFPLTGRVAQMLEDYLKNADAINAENLADIRVYLGLMVKLISTGESIGEDDPQNLLDTLPTG
jgi:chemotaxis protein histidine kinase CheA